MTAPQSTPNSPRANRLMRLADVARREALIRADEAFVLRMRVAVRAGLENVPFGVAVDTTSPVGALRGRAEPLQSGCSSPAAMCAIT